MNFSSDGNKSVAKILLKTGIPMVLSMTLQALYNIVDSAFVSRAETGEAALNALTLAFPVQMLVIALGIGTGVGVNALLSRALGQGDADKANRAAGNGFFLAAVVYLIFLAFGLFFTGIYVRSQTDDAMIGAMAIEYLRINCILSFGVAFFSVCEKLLQATGRSLFSTIAQVAGAATNIVLDPIMIYGLLGLPALGVSGAAWATVIGQIVSFALALFFHCKFNREVRKKLSDCKPSGKIILQIYAIGLPAIIAQALTSVMTYGMNRLLVKLSPAYVTAYGLYYKIQQFVLFAAFGLRDAITPLVSYEYGRGDGMRVRAAIKWGLLDTLIVMAAGLLVIEIAAAPIAGAFSLASQTQELLLDAIRIVSLGFLFAGANIALQGVFQATDGGLPSLIVSLLRQAAFVLPVAWGLIAAIAGGGDSRLVWITFPLAEGATLVYAAIAFLRTYRRKIAPLSVGDES